MPEPPLMASQFNYRPATDSDIPRLVEWTYQLMQHEQLNNGLDIPHSDNIKDHLSQWITNLLSNESVLFILAESEGIAVGCILGVMQLAPNEFTIHPVHGLIQMAWVEPEYRRSGLARELVAHMEMTFKNLDIPYCDIEYSQSNKEAEGFWQSIGYQAVSVTARKFIK